MACSSSGFPRMDFGTENFLGCESVSVTLPTLSLGGCEVMRARWGSRGVVCVSAR